MIPTTSPRTFTSGPPEFPGLMAASVCMNSPGLRASSDEGLGRFKRADDAARYRKAESEGVAESQNGLAGMQLRGIAPGRVGQVMAVDLDDRQVGQRVGAHHFGGQNPAIAHGDANVGRAIDHVVVGDDISVGRDDDPVPNPCSTRGCGCICRPNCWPNCWPKNCPNGVSCKPSGRLLSAVALVA